MPDLDIVEQKLPREWRPAYRLVKGGQPLEDVASALIKGLAAILRRHGGAPSLHRFARVVQRHDGGVLDDRSLAAVIRRLDLEMDTLGDRLLARAVLRPSVSGPVSALRGPADRRLAKQYLEELIEHGLLSKQRDYLVGRRFSTRQEAMEFENKLRKAIRPAVHRLARDLANQPRTRSVRAPRSAGGRRKSTRELLDEPI